MLGFWIQVVPAGLVGGVLGASVVLMTSGRRFTLRSPGEIRGPDETETAEGTGTPEEAERVPVRQQEDGSPCRVQRDTWTVPLNRCEQAVRRAGRAVEAVSSAQARRGLSGVVHRMDAELLNVRALVELGRTLERDEEAGGMRESAEQHDVAHRVHQQLTEAAARFGTVTDALLVSVLELVAHSEQHRLRERTTALRDQFPLLRPMSVILDPDAAVPADQPLLDTPA